MSTIFGAVLSTNRDPGRDLASAPIRSALRTEQTLRARLGKVVDEAVPIKPVVVFIHLAAELEIEKAPILVLPAEKLKKQVTIDAPKLDQAVYDQLDAFFQKTTLNK